MKQKRGGARDLRRHQHTRGLFGVTLDGAPVGVVWACDDPACLEGIHHPDPFGGGDFASNENDPRTGIQGPFSDSSDRDSEGAPGGQGTDN